MVSSSFCSTMNASFSFILHQLSWQIQGRWMWELKPSTYNKKAYINQCKQSCAAWCVGAKGNWVYTALIFCFLCRCFLQDTIIGHHSLGMGWRLLNSYQMTSGLVSDQIKLDKFMFLMYLKELLWSLSSEHFWLLCFLEDEAYLILHSCLWMCLFVLMCLFVSLSSWNDFCTLRVLSYMQRQSQDTKFLQVTWDRKHKKPAVETMYDTYP